MLCTLSDTILIHDINVKMWIVLVLLVSARHRLVCHVFKMFGALFYTTLLFIQASGWHCNPLLCPSCSYW